MTVKIELCMSFFDQNNNDAGTLPAELDTQTLDRLRNCISEAARVKTEQKVRLPLKPGGGVEDGSLDALVHGDGRLDFTYSPKDAAASEIVHVTGRMELRMLEEAFECVGAMDSKTGVVLLLGKTPEMLVVDNDRVHDNGDGSLSIAPRPGYEENSIYSVADTVIHGYGGPRPVIEGSDNNLH